MFESHRRAEVDDMLLEMSISFVREKNLDSRVHTYLIDIEPLSDKPRKLNESALKL